MSSSAAPSHVTESISDRKKSRELAEARQSGAAAPEVDVKTGSIINPHNPEFITRRPWYLGGNDAGPSLDHQADQRTEAEKLELSLAAADRLVQLEREKLKQQQKDISKFKLKKGMWVEALKRNKMPYLMCQIVKADRKKHVYDLKYEDGSLETKVKFHPKQDSKQSKLYKSKHRPRIRFTKTGNRSFAIDHSIYGKETYDSKRDKYHGYDAASNQHVQMIEDKFAKRDAVRRQKKLQRQEQQQKNDNDTENKNINTNKQKQAHSDSDSDTDYDSDSSGSNSDDEFVQRDEDAKTFQSRLARQGGVGGAQMKVTARNLRIREDTAKYLRNLDLNSAYYDPKSRSMRDNPNPEVNPEDLQFAGDNFARISGDAVGLAKAQLFAWDASGGIEGTSADGGTNAATQMKVPGVTGAATTAAALAGGEIHPQANPSQVELLKKNFDSKAEHLKELRKKTVLEKYGGAEYLDGGDGVGGSSLAPSSSSSMNMNNGKDQNIKTSGETAQERMVRFGASVINHEYTRDGRVIVPGSGGGKTGQGSGSNGTMRMKQKSKYDEDVFINGHNTVWGSYFHLGAFRWGYADDHSLMKNSYCTGPNGRIANDDANELRYGTGESGSASLAQAREMLKAVPQQDRQSSAASKANALHLAKSKLYGEADQNAELDQDKVIAALKRHEEETKTLQKEADDRKRKYNSLGSSNDVTEEDMEAYRLKKERSDDPMLKLSGEELLEY